MCAEPLQEIYWFYHYGHDLKKNTDILAFVFLEDRYNLPQPSEFTVQKGMQKRPPPPTIS